MHILEEENKLTKDTRQVISLLSIKDKQNNNEFEEEMRRLKITCAETINIDQTKINNLLQQNKKKTHTHTVSTTT